MWCDKRIAVCNELFVNDFASLTLITFWHHIHGLSIWRISFSFGDENCSSFFYCMYILLCVGHLMLCYDATTSTLRFYVNFLSCTWFEFWCLYSWLHCFMSVYIECPCKCFIMVLDMSCWSLHCLPHEPFEISVLIYMPIYLSLCFTFTLKMVLNNCRALLANGLMWWKGKEPFMRIL